LLLKGTRFQPTTMGCAILLLSVVSICSAQEQDQSQTAANQSWTSTSEQKSSAGNLNPTRSSRTHSEKNGRTVDTQSLQRLGPEGKYIPYGETEKETVRVDAGTVRTVTRTFGTGPDGQKMLVQVTEEESRKLPGDETRVVRTTSNPDINGKLQVVQRELENSKSGGPGVRETNTTISTPDGNGALSPSMQILERETSTGAGTMRFSKTTQLQDGVGHWQVGEVRQGTIQGQEGQLRTKEESVLRPDADGKLTVVERTVTKEDRISPEERRDITETYSTDTPGVPRESTLRLSQRITTMTKSSAGGARTSEEKVEKPNPGSPSDGLRVTQKAIDIVRPGTGGAAVHRQTIVTLDSNGNPAAVWVDMGKSDQPAAVTVDTGKSAKPQ